MEPPQEQVPPKMSDKPKKAHRGTIGLQLARLMTSDMRLLGDCERLARLCRRLSDAYGTKKAIRTEKTFQELERRVQGLHGAVTDEMIETTSKRSYKRHTKGSVKSEQRDGADDYSIIQKSTKPGAVRPDHNIRTGSAERHQMQHVDRYTACNSDEQIKDQPISSYALSKTGIPLKLEDGKYRSLDVSLESAHSVCDNERDIDFKHCDTRVASNRAFTGTLGDINDTLNSSVHSIGVQKDTSEIIPPMSASLKLRNMKESLVTDKVDGGDKYLNEKETVSLHGNPGRKQAFVEAGSQSSGVRKHERSSPSTSFESGCADVTVSPRQSSHHRRRKSRSHSRDSRQSHHLEEDSSLYISDHGRKSPVLSFGVQKDTSEIIPPMSASLKPRNMKESLVTDKVDGRDTYLNEKERVSLHGNPGRKQAFVEAGPQSSGVRKHERSSPNTSFESGCADVTVSPRQSSHHHRRKSRSHSRDSRQGQHLEEDSSLYISDHGRKSPNGHHRDGIHPAERTNRRRSSPSNPKHRPPVYRRTSRDNTPSGWSGDDDDSQCGEEQNRSAEWSTRRRSRPIGRGLNTSGSTGSRYSSDDGHVHDSGIHSRESRPSPRHTILQESWGGGSDSRRTSYDSQVSEYDSQPRGRRRRRVHNRRASSEYAVSDDYNDNFSSSREDLVDHRREISPRKDRHYYATHSDYSYDDYSDVHTKQSQSRRRSYERSRRSKAQHHSHYSESARATPVEVRDHSHREHRRRSSYDIQYNEYMSRQYEKLDSAIGHRPDSETRKIIPNGLAQLIQQALWLFEDLHKQDGSSRSHKNKTPLTVDTATDTSDMDYIERPRTKDYSSQTMDSSSLQDSRSETSTPDNILDIVRKEVHRALDAYEKLGVSNMSLSNTSIANIENENESDNYEHLWGTTRYGLRDIPNKIHISSETTALSHASDRYESVTKDIPSGRTVSSVKASVKSEHDLSSNETDDSSIYMLSKPLCPTNRGQPLDYEIPWISSTPESLQDINRENMSRRVSDYVRTDKRVLHPLLGIVDSSQSLTSSRDSITKELVNPEPFNSRIDDDEVISGDASASDITLYEIEYSNVSISDTVSPPHGYPSSESCLNDSQGGQGVSPRPNTKEAVGGFRPVLPKHPASPVKNTLPNSIHFFPRSVSGLTPSTSSPVTDMERCDIDGADLSPPQTDTETKENDADSRNDTKLLNSYSPKNVNSDVGQSVINSKKEGQQNPESPTESCTSTSSKAIRTDRLNPISNSVDSTSQEHIITVKTVTYNIIPQDSTQEINGPNLLQETCDKVEKSKNAHDENSRKNDRSIIPGKGKISSKYGDSIIDVIKPSDKCTDMEKADKDSGRHTPVLMRGLTSPIPGAGPDDSVTPDSNISRSLPVGLRTPQPRRRQSSIVRRHSVRMDIDRNIGLMALPNKPSVDTSETTWMEDLRPKRHTKIPSSASKPSNKEPHDVLATDIHGKRDKNKRQTENRPPKPIKKWDNSPPSTPKKERMKDKTWKNIVHIPAGHFCFKHHAVPPEQKLVSDKSREILRNTTQRPKAIVIDHKGSQITGVRALTSSIPVQSRSPTRTQVGIKHKSRSVESLPCAGNKTLEKNPRQLSQSTGCLPNTDSHSESEATRQLSRSTESLLETHRIVCAEMDAYRARSMETLDVSSDSQQLDMDTSVDISELSGRADGSHSDDKIIGLVVKEGDSVHNVTRHSSKIPVRKSQVRK